MGKYAWLLFAVFLPEAHATSSFTGLWFSCEGSSGEFQSLTVERSGAQYKGLLESSRNGGVYSAELTGTVRHGILELKGCQAHRGEVSPTCASPVAVKLGQATSSFKRIVPQHFERSIAECRARHKES